MVRYATIEDARKVVPRWQGSPLSVEHIGDRGNSVFSFKNEEGNLQILRFTDPEFRTFNELLAELHFVNYLSDCGVSVARGLPNTEGILAFVTPCSSGELICSSVSYARGLEVQEGSEFWNEDLFKEWGRNLALIHNAATAFAPRKGEPDRWIWSNEILIAKADDLIPQEDVKSREELHEVLARCESLNKSKSDFGMIHADHAPQNFRYDSENKRITAFDFGNCCYHWYASDLAISLSTVRRKNNRDKIRDSLLGGYSSIRVLPENIDELIDLFIRLRVVYVYLSRLHLWAMNRTAEQQKDLDLFRQMVHARTGWNRI